MFKVDHSAVERASAKAILVVAPTLKEEGVWVPQSVVHDDSEIWREGDAGTLVVEEWWAKKQGWL